MGTSTIGPAVGPRYLRAARVITNGLRRAVQGGMTNLQAIEAAAVGALRHDALLSRAQA